MSSHTACQLKAQAAQWLAQRQPALVISVDEIKGSTPREAGVRMLVSAQQVLGTIGGGHLEWQAIDLARQALAESGQHTTAWTKTFPLGPTLGQCCGGVVTLRFAPLNAAELDRWPTPPARFHLELHGAGHVGQAIIRLLSDIDCTVRWIDERGDDMPADDDQAGLPDAAMLAALPEHIQWLPSDAAQHEVADAPAHAAHLVLTHRHDLDLRIIHAVLQRGEFAFAGLIGSQTKRAKFLHRLVDLGIPPETLGRLTCPIGLPELAGKEPPVIAVSVVAQLLQRFPPPASH